LPLSVHTQKLPPVLPSKPKSGDFFDGIPDYDRFAHAAVADGVHLGSYVCQVKTNDISFLLKCDLCTAKFDGVLLKSPNIDTFCVSVVGSIEKSSPTFVVGQQVSSCSHIDATIPRNPLNVYSTLPFYHTPSPLSNQRDPNVTQIFHLEWALCRATVETPFRKEANRSALQALQVNRTRS
ncbi:hypothetical protein BJV78DRAFT_1262677, partial [Lactifluus subvellereus]